MTVSQSGLRAGVLPAVGGPRTALMRARDTVRAYLGLTKTRIIEQLLHAVPQAVDIAWLEQQAVLAVAHDTGKRGDGGEDPGATLGHDLGRGERMVLIP